MPDVTIVGGGPAGTYSARLLASSGRDVTLIEDHHCAGLPVHCAGVVSSEVIRNMGVKPEFLGSISSADVVLPDGSLISTRKSTPYAYIINRSDFDQKLADMAESSGVTIEYGVRYKSYQYVNDGISIDTNVGSIKSDLLIGADGQSSLIAASLGENQAKSYIRGFQVDVKYRSEEEHKMTLYLGNTVAPGFFAWQLPMGDVTRFGLGVNTQSGPPMDYVEKFLTKLGVQDKERLATYVGKIPIGGRRTSFADRILLIGDAAGQVKPVSGGGLYPISKVAPFLKETVDRAYSMNIFNSTVLALYERSWKRELGKSLNGGMRLRRYYDRLSDDDLNMIGHIFAREDVSKLLSDIDIDDPHNVVKPILKCKGIKGPLIKAYMRTIL